MIKVEKDKYSKDAPQETHKINIFNFKDNSNNPHCTFIQPLPDEFVRGHIGRWGKLLGFKSYSACISNLKRKHENPNKKLATSTVIKIVSEATGFSCEKYIYLHTLLPFLCFASPDNVFDSNGQLIDSVLRRNSCILARTQAHFCPMCIEEDKNSIGYSYWRRTHQLPGHFWCHKHSECLLYFVDHKDPFHQLPEYWLKHENSKTYSELSAEHNHLKIQLFCHVCQIMLESNIKKRIKTVIATLKKRSISMSLNQSSRTDYTPKNDRLSDIAIKKFPAIFINKLFNNVTSKKHRDFFPAIDQAIFASRSTALSTGTATAIATLFDSIEIAFEYLNSEKEQIITHNKKPSYKIIRSSFFSSQGAFKDLAKDLNINVKEVIRLIILNKKNILDMASIMERSALEAFLAGECTLNEACAKFSVNPTLLEKLVWLYTTKIIKPKELIT